MSFKLPYFDNTWYCDKCNEQIKDKNDFIYCPKCGNVLKNDQYQKNLESIEKCLDNFSKSICEDCGEEFDEDYNFCPFCSKELKKESITKRLDKNNSLIAKWNGEETCIFDKEIFLSSVHFSRTIVTDCFKWKNCLDNKLESDFIEINAKPPQKLSFKETFSIFILKERGEIVSDVIKFLPEYNEDDFNHTTHKDEDIDILKIRDDLYVILTVYYVLY